ncbi:MAG: glycosyltransferase [Polyangiaceae bacterium]|nr:glycosyltransferase [Polyangiaceae bacterium]
MTRQARMTVVIGFRDWGLDRLVVAVRAHVQSSMGHSCDVLVVDYGSRNADEVRSCVEAEGARVVRTEVDGPWSRSRALNVGVLAAQSEVLVTTDADILFSPQALETIAMHVEYAPQCLHVLQCKDLPEGWGPDRAAEFDWRAFEAESLYRPRWGMGGMAAFRREQFDRIRGYDARMHTYGAEDLDFAERMRRAGMPVNWIDDARARIYHIWHPSTREATNQSQEGTSAVFQNRAILLEDDTLLRNYAPDHRIEITSPAASIVIATRGRIALLKDSIASCVTQTVRDIEVLVVDDGSTEDVCSVVESFADPRLRYIRQPALGVGHARNAGAAHARSEHIVIHDDDDIMLPRRVELHLSALRRAAQGTTGGWVDFDNETGHMVPNSGAEFSYDALLFRPKTIVHGASMLPRSLLRAFPYDEELPAGVDYNLFLRLAKAGLQMRHTQHMHILRRLHGANLTSTQSDAQRDAARRTTRLILSEFSLAELTRRRAASRATPAIECMDLTDLELYVPHLPGHLLERTIVVTELSDEGAERLLRCDAQLSSGLTRESARLTNAGLQRELVFRAADSRQAALIAQQLGSMASGERATVSVTSRRRKQETAAGEHSEPEPHEAFQQLDPTLDREVALAAHAAEPISYVVEGRGFESAATARECIRWLRAETAAPGYVVSSAETGDSWCVGLATDSPIAARFALSHLRSRCEEAVCGSRVR